MAGDVFFLVDLVQDVGVIAPLIRLLHRKSEAAVGVLAAKQFYQRDVTTIWQTALEKTCNEAGVEIHVFGSEAELHKLLQHRRGFLVSASESSVPAHAVAHQAFKCAPSSFVTVSLQHGFECVGFLHNRAHDRAHGARVAFAADILCSWFGLQGLRSLAPDQAHKVYVAGPPSVIDAELGFVRPPEPRRNGAGKVRCLVCENLHSVRLHADELRDSFIAEMFGFVSDMRDHGGEIVLRSHPAGRFAAAARLQLPKEVGKSEGPLEETLSRGIDFGISAPSSVLFDMIKAGIPVAVWRDAAGIIDVENYAGLPVVTRAEDWVRLAGDSLTRRAQLVENQNRFLDSFDIPHDVSARYLSLLTASV